MLKLAMIAPICLIGEASKYSDCAMWLTHMLDNEDYVNAINKRPIKQPSFLDNSFFELGEAIPLDDMRTRAGRLNEDVIFVLPDGEFSGYKEAPSMVVPKTQNDLWAALRLLLEKECHPIKIGISCIHARRELKLESYAPDTRYNFVEGVLRDFPAEEAERVRRSGVFHFLGLNNEPWEEIKLLSKTYAGSLDSSAFIWPHIKTFGRLNIWDIKDKFATPVDFTADVSLYVRDSVVDHMFKARSKLRDYSQ